MDDLSNELSLLASLLEAPDIDTKEAVLELAVHYQWLQPAAEELENLSVDAWKAEHNRLFANCTFNTPCPQYGFKHDHSAHPQGLPLQPLKQLYKRMGLGFINASADYLGILLECASHLNSNPALGRVFWSELWHEHLASSIPGFCNILKFESQLTLYHIVAERLCILFPRVQSLATNVA